MGVDLRWLVPNYPKQRDGSFGWLCLTMIDLTRRRDLWEPIADLPSEPAPKVTGYCAALPDGESGWGEIIKDAYGEKLRFTTAGNLAGLSEMEAVKDNPLNRAAFAYVANLPSDWPIVLYWH